MSGRVLVIGNDLAGLTAAWRLLQKGFDVTILAAPLRSASLSSESSHASWEEAPHRTKGSSLLMSDPHSQLLFGPLDQTHSLLHDIQSPLASQPLTRLPLYFVKPSEPLSRYSVYPLPSPWHSLLALLTFCGLPIRDRIGLLNHLETWWENACSPLQGDQQSAESWLRTIGQSPSTFPAVWNPLCRFLLGDELSATSAGFFTSALTQWLLSKRTNAYISLPSYPVENFLVGPLQEKLRSHGADIQDQTVADALRMTPNTVTGVQLRNGRTLTADWYVASLKPEALTALLPERLLARSAYFYHISQLRELSSITVYLSLPQVRIPAQLCLSNNRFHWFVSRFNVEQRSSLVSCVATAQDALLEHTDHELFLLATQDLQHIPRIPKPCSQIEQMDYDVIRKPKAFLSPAPGMAGLRPHQQSPLVNLFLAGEWTDTGLPVGLESAIVSGNRCSRFLSAQAGLS